MKLKIGTFKNNNYKPVTTPELVNAISDFGIEVVQSGHDVTIRDIYEGPLDEPTIGYDRLDTVLLTPAAYERGEENKNLLGYLLPCLALEEEKNKCPCYFNNYSVDEYTGSKKPIDSMNNWIWVVLRQPWAQSLSKPKQDIRASFAGTVWYKKATWSANHRKRLMEVWPNDNTFAVFNGRPLEKRFAFDERVFSYSEHYQIVARSKVVVSPFGVSEVSIRDYEAVIAGCILIKPHMSKMQIYLNPFHEETTVYCKQDYSDLDKALEIAEQKWESTHDLREHRSQEMLKNGRDIHSFAELLSGSIKRILDAQIGAHYPAELPPC